MPTFHIELDDGRKFEIDAIDQQSALAAIPHIQSQAQPLDQYHQKARDLINSQAAQGRDISGGYLDKYLKGATMGFGDEIVAGLRTGLGAIVDPMKHIGDPSYKSIGLQERYNYEKALEDERAKDADRKTGALGTVAELAGGLGTGLGAARSGATLVREGQQFLPRLGASAAEGAGYGAVSGAGEGDGFKDRLQKALQGGATGGAFGAALPIAGAVAKTTAAPALSNLSARIDPEGYARSLLARAQLRSGRSADEIAALLDQAQREGQGNYTLAEALGTPGQRLLAGEMKAPGEGKTLATDFLERRQANQGDELRGFLRHGLDAPITANQMDEAVRGIRSQEADTLYGIADANARPVDVTPAIQAADQFLGPNLSALEGEGSQLGDDTVSAVVRRARNLIAPPNGEQVFDYQSALRRKRDLDAMIASANPAQQRFLMPIRNALDEQLAQASDMYATARDAYRRRSNTIDAIAEGQGARRELPEDSIPAFNQMERDPQSAFRVGYADDLMGTLGGPPGVNKARGLTGDYEQQRLQAFALPGRGDRLLRQIERSGEMNRTRNMATGGSSTAENLADAADAGVDPRLFSQIMQGNVMGALNTLGTGVGNAVTGNTEAVRNEVLRLLMSGQIDPTRQQPGSILRLLRNLGLANNSRAPTTDIRRLLNELQTTTRRRQNVEATALRGLLSMGGQQAGSLQ